MLKAMLLSLATVSLAACGTTMGIQRGIQTSQTVVNATPGDGFVLFAGHNVTGRAANEVDFAGYVRCHGSTMKSKSGHTITMMFAPGSTCGKAVVKSTVSPTVLKKAAVGFATNVPFAIAAPLLPGVKVTNEASSAGASANAAGGQGGNATALGGKGGSASANSALKADLSAYSASNAKSGAVATNITQNPSPPAKKPCR